MAPKHNNMIHNNHFHKQWQNYVKTWFDQPGRKKRKRVARNKRALQVAPRPVAGALRPIVRCPTFKYNTKNRAGRGFTLEELKVGFVIRLISETKAMDHFGNVAFVLNSFVSNSNYGMLRGQIYTTVICSQVASFPSPEAMFLLVSTKNCDFFKSPIFGACTENSFHILSQSDCQTWLWACAEWWEFHELWTSRTEPSQRSQFLVLTKRSAASGKENGASHNCYLEQKNLK